MEEKRNASARFNALVIGATGATGRDVISVLLRSQEWQNVYVISRRALPDWDDFSSNNKLKLIICKDFEVFNKEKKEIIETLGEDIEKVL
jgi:N-acetyl-gamma-glutamylphosphate reductase